MKKSLIRLTIMLAAAAMIAAFSCPAQAAVTGPCVNCHTMHNSQGGTPMVFGVGVTGAQKALVKSNCLGCHTTTSGDPLPSAGTQAGYPFVKGNGFTDANCLAGGFFSYTDDDGDDNKGKAHSLASTVAPPGYTTGYSWYTGTTNGLSCAGSNGCHGAQDELEEMTAIKGGHHSPTAYRILVAYNGGSGSEADVVGTGAADYEKALNASYATEPTGNLTRSAATYAHNIYKAGSGSGDDDTISRLCANCHGDFHSDIGSAGSWHRHPTDVDLPTDWEVQGDTLVTDYDCKYNPFGFTDHTTTTGTKYATCLSCHRAHGTGNHDLLRFKYDPATDGSTEQQAGRSTGTVIEYGCLGCHSKQR